MRILSCLEVRDQTRVPQDPPIVQLSPYPRFHEALPVRLTPTEYRLLEELVRHAGTILPHRVLLERVWGPKYVGDAHYLKVFVRRLRRKLGDDPERPRYIHTEWGIGYRFASPR